MENELRKTFYKKDLETGMVIETRDGCRYLVLITKFSEKNINFVNLDNWASDTFYENNLKIKRIGDNPYDIIKVYTPKNLKIDNNMFHNDNLQLIWDRYYRKDMNIYDIEFELGYKINLVDFQEQYAKEVAKNKYIPDTEYNPESHDGGWID